MSNTNNNMQTQTSSALHNAIMEAGGKDHPPMLALSNYNPPCQYKFKATDADATPVTPGNDEDIQKYITAEAVQIILTGIDNDIYSTVDACPNAMEISQAATKNRGKEISNSPLSTYDLEPEANADDEASSKDKEIDKLMALILISFKKIYKPTINKLRTSSTTRNINVDNTPRSNREIWYARQTGQHDNQRAVNISEARENVGAQVVQETGIQCYNCKEFRHVARESDWRDETDDKPEDQELEAHYMYMAKIQEVTPDDADNSGPIFDTEPLQKVHNSDDDYNVFTNERQHPKQPESVNDTYLMEQYTDFLKNAREKCATAYPNSHDLLEWRNKDGLGCSFSAHTVWNIIRTRGSKVRWYDVVWFSCCSPSHAVHLWLVIRRRLKTQDLLRHWDNVNYLHMTCSLCESQPDSHEHLFFECSFSQQVWNQVKGVAGLASSNASIYDTIDDIIPFAARKTSKSINAKLVVAATSYFIWQERNGWLFKNKKRTVNQVVDCIMNTVRLKLMSCRLKKSRSACDIVKAWNLSEGILIS
ncbi:retrovirus-related pol polyprotein from transposon TNT 1-94 [Tanacetum coccineum]